MLPRGKSKPLPLYIASNKEPLGRAGHHGWEERRRRRHRVLYNKTKPQLLLTKKTEIPPPPRIHLSLFRRASVIARV